MATLDSFTVVVRIGKFVVIAALVAATGAHWLLLQSVAWTTMFADNFHSASLQVALIRTFDGKHPCCLCKAIAAGKKSEQKREFTAQTQKLEFPPAKENFTLIAPSQFQLMPRVNTFADTLPLKPPTPPPRGFFV